MTAAITCPECQAPLPPGAPGGLCPACLLKRGLEPNTLPSLEDHESKVENPRWTAPTLDDVAARFPELEVLQFLGRGGMGAVYRVRQKNLDRLAALKILPREIGTDPAFTERFAREAQAMARLNHPHIVTIYEFGERGGSYYFLMELVDGLNLRAILHAPPEGHLSPGEALAIVPQICEALQYAHANGIVHRDIKPENILLNKQGQVKIADFGLAKLMNPGPGSALRTQDSVAGTPAYMAPEQFERPAEVDHRADIYSLGVVFYQMLTGELPTGGRGRFTPPSNHVQIDVRLDEVVLKALQREPEKRYQHATEIKTQIETITTTPAEISHLKSPASARGVPPDIAGLGPSQVPPVPPPPAGIANFQSQGSAPELLLRIIAVILYSFAALIAIGPVIILMLDPGDRGHQGRFLTMPLAALTFAIAAFFFLLLARFLVAKVYNIPPIAPPRFRRRPAIIFLAALALCYAAGITFDLLYNSTDARQRRSGRSAAVAGLAPSSRTPHVLVPATTPPVRSFSAIPDLLAGLPQDALPDPSAGWDEFTKHKADKWLAENITDHGHRITLAAAVKSAELRRISPKGKLNETLRWDIIFVLEPIPFEFEGRRLTAKINSSEPDDPNATHFTLYEPRSVIYFSGDEALARWAKSLKPGDKVTFTAILSKAAVWQSHPAQLWLLLRGPAPVQLPATLAQ